MRILIACEFSGIVREAFRRRGHDAWSCDLLPTEIPGAHYQGDVLKILCGNWDMMIAHPPCTYLSYAANRYWNQVGREAKRGEAMRFFMALVNANIPRICIENPLGLPGKEYRKPDQIIHPYYFGEGHLKRTCLWLKNLPPLFYIERDSLFGESFGDRAMIPKPEPIYIDKTPRRKKRYYVDANHGGHIRSKSFPGIAEAMAAQWSWEMK